MKAGVQRMCVIFMLSPISRLRAASFGSRATVREYLPARDKCAIGSGWQNTFRRNLGRQTLHSSGWQASSLPDPTRTAKLSHPTSRGRRYERRNKSRTGCPLGRALRHPAHYLSQRRKYVVFRSLPFPELAPRAHCFLCSARRTEYGRPRLATAHLETTGGRAVV